MAKKTSAKNKNRPVEVKKKSNVLYGFKVFIVCLTVFAAPLAAGSLTTWHNMMIQLLVFLAAILWLIETIQRGTIDLPGKSTRIFAAVFFCLLVLSAINTQSPNSTILEMINITSYLLIFLMTAGLFRDKKAINFIIWSMIASLGIVSAIGIREYIFAQMRNDPGWRIFSTFFNPDFLAGFLSLMLPVALAWTITRKTFPERFIAGLVLIMTLVCIPLTGSRFGLLTAFFGLMTMAVLWILSGRINKKRLLTIGVPILIFVLLIPLLAAPIRSRLLSSAQSHSAVFRLGTWAGTIRIIKAHPIKGTGIGTFEVAYPKYASLGFTKYTHNSYLQIASEAGPAAALAVLALIISVLHPIVLKTARKKLETEDDKPETIQYTRIILCGLIGGAAAFLARNFIDSDWYITSIGTSFWTILGITYLIGLPSEVKPVRIPKTAQIVSISALFLAAIVISIMIRGEGLILEGKRLTSAGNIPRAEAVYEKAIELSFFNTESLRRLTQIQIAYAKGTGSNSHYKDAEATIKKAIGLEPLSARNYYIMGFLYDQQDSKTEEAAEAYKAAVERDPNSLPSLLALARIYEALGKHDESIDIYRRMIELEESKYDEVRALPEVIEHRYIFARIALGKEMELRKDKAAAIQHYQIALDRIDRYQSMGQGMIEILDLGGFQTTETAASIGELRNQVTEALDRLSR